MFQLETSPTICHRLKLIEINSDSTTKMLTGLQIELLEVCINAGFSPLIRSKVYVKPKTSN